MSPNLRSLLRKLNDPTRSALEAGAGLCLSRTHYDLEIEHYLLKVLDSNDSDFAFIARRFEIDKSRFSAELARSLDKLKSGNARTPGYSPTIVKMLVEAWSIGSIDFGAERIRTGFTIMALLTNEELIRIVRDISKELQKIAPGPLHDEFASIVAGSREGRLAVDAAAPAGSGATVGGGKTPNLDKYTLNLTENARIGKIDPVLARDKEIRQVIDILTRRRQNNPILTGEAGVGKTAVVEGFALRVAQGDVPPALKNVTVRSLDLALLQAGAGVKGEFESRLKELMAEVKSSATPIILFIDEAHTMIGAGGQAGQNDAANLLKPALARGELRTIAATTWSEYKKYFEKDAALARRFQVVKVDEPAEQQCMVMMRGLVGALEKHHNLRILDEGVSAAVHLSLRYLAGRQLPDKAVSVLDTACARLSLGQNATPPAIEDAVRQIDDLEVQKRILQRESAVGVDHAERLQGLSKQKREAEAQLSTLRERYEREVKLVEQIRDLRTRLEEIPLPSDGDGSVSDASVPSRPLTTSKTKHGGKSRAAKAGAAAAATAVAPQSEHAQMQAQLASLESELSQLQGEAGLIRVCVDAQIVGEVISGWTGIPVGKMMKDEIATVLSLEEVLGKRVIGQTHALEVISQRIQTARARLDDPQKPVGVFMLVGPSGVGKTETALALSDLLYGGEHNLITINMSEFQEAHTISTLKGSPPGYVGYGEGGVLTEAVRRRPYSVVLLDEVEKAHPDVMELFYQVFDKGQMEDGEGRQIDFKNNIIILTTNACTDVMMELCNPAESPLAPGDLVQALKPGLNKIFKPALLGRMVIVPYYPIRDENLKKIVELKLKKIQNRIEQNHRISLTYDDSLVEEVALRCTEVESGARNVDNILTNSLLPDISCQLLGWMAEGSKLRSIHVSTSEGRFVYS